MDKKREGKGRKEGGGGVVISGMEWSQRVAFGPAVDPGPEARREGEGGKVGKWLTSGARNACTAPDRRASLGNVCTVGRLPSRSLGKAAAKLSCPYHSQAMQGHDGGPRRCLSMYVQSIRYISVYTADITTKCVLKSYICTRLFIDIYTQV